MDGERLVECVAALYRLLIAREQLAPGGDIEREIHIGREGYQQRDGYHDCGDDYLRALVLCGGAAFSLICHNFLRSGLVVCGSIRQSTFFHPLLFGYKHLAGLAALERSDDTLALEFVHEPCGAGITELQFALEKSC